MTNKAYAPHVTRSEIIPVEEFLELNSGQRKNILSTKIIPPTFEGDDFGFIELEHKNQRYTVDSVFG